MTSKRLLALLLAMLMLVALFSACAADDGAKDDGGKDSSASTDTGSKDDAKDDGASDDAGDDAGVTEEDKPTIFYLGRSSGANPDPESPRATAEEARDNEFETYVGMMDLIHNKHNVNYQWDVVLSEAELTTLSGYIAANNMPDMFNSREILDDATILQLAQGGRLAAVDEVLEYSDGSAKSYYNDPEKCLYLKAFAMLDDGNWYYVPAPNSTSHSMDFSSEAYPQRSYGQVNGAYSICVRQDWLEKFGLDMPTTTEEFHEMLNTFQDQDANGNGVNEERLLALMANEGNYMMQTCGIGQWFGLAYQDFIEDPATGVIEVACLNEGYKPWLSYMASLYADNLMIIEGGHPWIATKPVQANEISAYCMEPSSAQFTTTGDANSMYMPMPVVQAVEGITPRVLVQEAQAAFVGFCFSADCDYEAGGRVLDWLCSRELYLYLRCGVEGIAYEWANEEQTAMTMLATDDIYTQKSCFAAGHRWASQNFAPVEGGWHGNLWGVPTVHYDDPQAALDAGEPFLKSNQSREEWLVQYPQAEGYKKADEQMLMYLAERGFDNIHPCAYYSYTTMATSDEAAFLADTQTDLTTYLTEMATSVVIGAKSVDEVDDMIQFAYDNLYFQEYINVMQARVNRYLEVIGRPIVPIAE